MLGIPSLFHSEFLILLLIGTSKTQEVDINNNTNDSCIYDGNFPENFVPWTVLISPEPRQVFVGALINSTTILTTGEALFLKRRYKILPFANYSVRIGPCYSNDGKELVQIGNVSYIKPHPNIPPYRRRAPWPVFAHDWVLIFLKEPIQFSNGIGPVCLPTKSFIHKITISKQAAIDKLSDVLIHGTREFGSTQTSYYVKLRNNTDCHHFWRSSESTQGYPYKSRVCGFISQPSSNISCIPRNSPSVLSDENRNWVIIGFQNFRRIRRERKCDESYLIYMSLLVVKDLEWLYNNTKCGHLQFACDGGTTCVDLKTVCDGKTHQCGDKSDQNSFYCDMLSGCQKNQFKCSKGLAAYCIPQINPETGKVAKDCNSVRDCPNGEDEELCQSNPIWLYIGIGVTTLLMASLVLAFGCRRSRKLRDLTEEELIDFFHGERHLQNDGEHVVENTDVETRVEVDENEILLENNADNEGLINRARSSDVDTSICPEFIRRRGYDTSLDFDVRNPSHCTLDDGPPIGEGRFGVIKKGFVRGKRAAIKYPNLSMEENAFKVLLLELKITEYIHVAAGDTGHPNILRFIGADTTRVRQRILFVALEFCENGDIKEYIGNNRAYFQQNICGPPLLALGREQTRSRSDYDFKMTDDTHDTPMPKQYPLQSECLRRLIRWAAQIASGMKFLSHKVIHLDLAARNVLLDSNFVAKVGDFGLSRRVYGNSYEFKRNDPLPFRWLALEVLETNKCSQYSDIWSYGVTLWELFSLCEYPWGRMSDSTELIPILRSGERLSFPKYANLEIYQQMLCCWNEKPDERPSFAEMEAFFETLLIAQTQI